MKIIKKADCDAEIARLEYLIANYKYSEKELAYFKKCLSNAHKMRNLLASKKESKGANQWAILTNFLNAKNT